jgi:NAD-dependent deacetylase
MKSCSVDDLNTPYDISPEHTDINIGDLSLTGKQLRPFIVWFGEPVPMIEKAAEEVSHADVFVVIGSSLQVYPAAGLLAYARKDIPVYLIDPKPVNTYREGIHFIRKGSSEGVKELTALLLKSL